MRKEIAALRTLMEERPAVDRSGGHADHRFGGIDGHCAFEPRRRQIGRARVGKECRSRWSPYH